MDDGKKSDFLFYCSKGVSTNNIDQHQTAVA